MCTVFRVRNALDVFLITVQNGVYIKILSSIEQSNSNFEIQKFGFQVICPMKSMICDK